MTEDQNLEIYEGEIMENDEAQSPEHSGKNEMEIKKKKIANAGVLFSAMWAIGKKALQIIADIRETGGDESREKNSRGHGKKHRHGGRK